jgi:hypothetical protein
MKTLNSIDREHGVLWSFVTPRYTIAYWAEPEDMEPADSLEFAEDIEAIRSGAVDWFCAFMGAFDANGNLIDYDCLGGCAYTTARSFAENDNRNGYFRDMVHQTLTFAREREIRNQFVGAES